MANVELSIQVTDVPDEVAAHPCTVYFTVTIPYHHAMPLEAWRESIAHELEQTAIRIRAGQQDPGHEHHDEPPVPIKTRRRTKGAA